MPDRRHVYGEESSIIFSRFIGVELDSEGSVMSTDLNIKNLNFKRYYITHQLVTIIFLYHLAQARPHNVLHNLNNSLAGHIYHNECCCFNGS